MNQIEHELTLICIALHTQYKGDRQLARAWLSTPNINLGNKQPLALIYHGASSMVLNQLVKVYRQE